MSTALLIRHAERPPIPAGDYGHDLALTEAGAAAAVALGESLRSRPGRLFSSPVPRCMQTARAIAAGAGRAQAVTPDRWLGDPGPWVVDLDQAGPVFLGRGVRAVVQAQLAGGLPGMRALDDGCALLLGPLLDDPPQAGHVDVHVTHDAVLAPLIGALFGGDAAASWPGFLEGVAVVVGDAGLRVTWRGRAVRWPPQDSPRR
ncbi:MAG: histidine phosphatase family protein [Alphaproteobacteria bacterium]|nr:histidine phosphatase family protein [Alphaproteobacteria bacterium]